MNDKRGIIVPTIVLKHKGNAEQINMDILGRWVRGKGIADRTWHGLLGVLRVHCPGLAQDIEETLRSETDMKYVEAEMRETDMHGSVPILSDKEESKPINIQPSDSINVAATASIFQLSLEEYLDHIGIQVDYALLDEKVCNTEHMADIAKKITQWRDLFPYFGLEDYQKEEIEAAGDLSEQKRKLLSMWTQKLGPRATYRLLCTILWGQHRADLVELVCEVIKTPNLQPSSHTLPRPTTASSHSQLQSLPQPPPPSHHLPLTPSQPPLSALDRYRSHLRAVYTQSEIPDLKWPPSPGKKFINLAVIPKERTTSLEADQSTIATLRGDVNQILKSKPPIQLEDIFTVEAGEQLKCALVEGAPGMGKSTLAWHVCQQWGKGELFQQFSMVQLLQLRDTRVQAATCVEDLFSHYDKKLQSEAVQEISNSHGEGTLIILDGLDELPSQLLSQASIFTGLLSGEILPRATIMITSRHSVIQKIWKNWKQQISRHIEIIGFSERNEYVNSVLPSQELSQFRNYLSINSHIERMMYVPLHCAIVTIVYLDCQKSCRPPPRTQDSTHVSHKQFSFAT